MPKKEPGKLVDGIYTLIKPLELPGNTINEVKIKSLKAEDAIAAEKELQALTDEDFSQAGSYQRQVCLISKMIELPLLDTQKLSLADITELQGFLL